MKNFQKIEITVVAVLVFGSVFFQSLSAQSLKVFSIDPANLINIRQAVQSTGKEYTEPYKKLLRDADKTMKEDLVSVMDKDQTPPSGDKHDYMSLGRYYWPDPAKPDGLPYIQKDGETNPEVETITDRKNIDKTVKCASTLSLAYFFSGKEEYAEKAAQVLRNWFLNPETRMNPNLNYGQIQKGKEGGRPSGLIEMRGMYMVVDAVGLLNGSKSWTEADQTGMKTWFESYFTWLNENSIGIKEAATTNNHGTWIRVQKIAIAQFLGKNDVADSLINEAKTKVIAVQITPEGEQPRESARTRSLHYTHFNLEALFVLASLAQRNHADLWNYQTEDGRSIRKALDWVYPVVTGEKKWEKQQIDDFKMEDFYPMLIQAAYVYKDERYAQTADDIGGENGPKDRVHLFYPTK